MKTITVAAAAISMAVVLTAAAATLTATTSANRAIISHSRPVTTAQLDAAIHPDTPVTPDSSYPGALNAFWIWLTGSVKEGMLQACQSPRYGTIYLKAGDYMWNLFLSADSERTITIPLEAGYYTWNDCILPVPGQSKYNYDQYSILCPPNASPRTPCVALHADEWNDSGNYWVGSALTWLHRLNR